MNLSVTLEVFIAECQILGTNQVLITKIPSEKYLINNISVIVFNAILILPTIALNLVASITILKTPQLKSKPCYFIILAQSVIDLAVGVVGIPSYISFIASWTGGASSCLSTSLLFRGGMISVLSSLVTVSILTLERYIAIIHPYAYKTQVTKKRIVICTASSAVVHSGFVAVSYLGKQLVMIYGMISAGLVFFFTTFAYTRIFFVARSLVGSPSQPHDVGKLQNVTKTKLLRQKIKLAKSCFAVVICFFSLCFLPQAIAFPYYTDLKKVENIEIGVWIGTIVLVNSSANSVLFFWAKKMLRKEGIKFLKAIPCINKTESWVEGKSQWTRKLPAHKNTLYHTYKVVIAWYSAFKWR